MPWNKDSFDAYNGGRSGAQLWAARQVMGQFIDAIAGGYADQLWPSSSCRRPQAEVDSLVESIDQEWEKERSTRGRDYHNHTQFASRLGPEARAALVEALEKAIDGAPGIPPPQPQGQDTWDC